MRAAEIGGWGTKGSAAVGAMSGRTAAQAVGVAGVRAEAEAKDAGGGGVEGRDSALGVCNGLGATLAKIENLKEEEVFIRQI